MQTAIIAISKMTYQWAVRPVLFLFDPEEVHDIITRLGQRLSMWKFARFMLALCFKVTDDSLSQDHFGMIFSNPLGLAAGYDYEARLTMMMPSVGFGFGSIGTLTRERYAGNKKPLLGRLPKSRSLMVNKGFKNDGIEKTLKRLEGLRFMHPVGVSIGQTNDEKLDTLEKGIADIIASFTIAERSGIPFAYYELNISCPNLKHAVDFYKPEQLNTLLESVEALGLTRPVFVKMPISTSDQEILAMMRVIVRHSLVRAVIIGNLQHDRTHPALLPEEVNKFSVGNFSGMACQARSDELIRLVFRHFGKRILIIGCGGIFSADDAYRKLALGASLLQIVTGLIFEGPQIAADINHSLILRLKHEGFLSIKDLIGTAS